MYDVATAQNNEEDEEEINKEYESQPIISLKAALESVDNLMRFVNDPPSGFVRHYRFEITNFALSNGWIKLILITNS